jgi:S-adenosylhomocysteine hydrolase
VKFAFDNVYGPKSTNGEIFDDVIKPMLDTLLNGFNCSVFAYGATGYVVLSWKELIGVKYEKMRGYY